ncbi:MAG: VWD domain-containing protein [Emticicia sp.]|uniref:VWD domain-containing protein n=1 Tax=Emticicia sp. TaxID=1930953 RepID=UPI003BA840CB
MKKIISYLSIFLLLSCSKDTIPSGGNTTNPTFKLSEPASLTAAQQAIITNPNIAVGYVASYEDKKLQVIAAGKKNTSGEMTNLEKLILVNTTNNAWIKYDFNADFLPSKAETSNGFIIEFSNYQGTKFDIIVKKKADGKEVTSKKGETMYEGNLELAQKAKTYFANGIDYTKSGRVQGILVCDKTIGGIAAGAYIAQNIAGCITAGTALLAAPELGIIATFTAGRTALDACSETKKLIDNLQNNRPAIQCPEAGGAEQSCFSNIVSETGQALSSCGQTVANTWLTRKACECNDQLQTRDLLDGVGSGQGDPHITTHDGYDYDFMGHGEFTAVQSTTDKFLIQVRQEPMNATEKRATINTGIAVRFEKDVINVFSNPFKLLINGENQSDAFASKRLSDNTLVTKNSEEIRLLSPTKDEVIIRYKNRIDYLVFLNPDRKTKLKGILGNFDGNRNNDLTLADGKLLTDKSFKGLYPAYADAWRIKQNESIFTYESGKSTTNYTDVKFPYQEFAFSLTALQQAESRCRQAGINREPYLSHCIYDVSLTGDIAFAESAKWAQSLASFSTLPVASDISYFQGVRLEVGSRQNQSDIKNVIDFDAGKTYTFAEAKSNRAIDGVAYYDIIQSAICTFGFLKTCGISCGVGSLNDYLKSISWNIWNTGMIQISNGSDKAFKLKITNIDFYNVQNSAGIASLLQNKLKKDSDYENGVAVIEDFDKGIDNQHVFAFITADGKQGLFRITGTGINPITKVSYYDIDIKIQK